MIRKRILSMVLATVCAASVALSSAVATNAATNTSIVNVNHDTFSNALEAKQYPIKIDYTLGGMHFTESEKLGVFKENVDLAAERITIAKCDMQVAMESGSQKEYAKAKEEYVKTCNTTKTLKYIDFDNEKFTVLENVKDLAYTVVVKADYKELSSNYGAYAEAKNNKKQSSYDAFKSSIVKDVTEEQYVVFMDAGFSFDLNKLFGSNAVITDYNTAPYMSKAKVEKTGATNYKQYKISSSNKVQFWQTENTYNTRLKITNGNQSKDVYIRFLVTNPTNFANAPVSSVFHIGTTGNTSYKNIVYNFSKANIAEVKNGGKYTLEALTNIGNGENPVLTKLNWVITKGANLISLSTSYNNPEGICFAAKGTGSVEGYANTYNGTVKRFVINIK